MDLEQAYKLKKEASNLSERLRKIFIEQSIDIVRIDPFSSVPQNMDKLRRIKNKAEKREYRRRELWANIKWPGRQRCI